GLLHDIGKIGVPNEIINSPTKLTDEEYDVIKTHPGIGFDILAEMKSHPELSTGARWHHERFDGGGYPDHKTNEEIPLEARIIAVADSYDAMTSNRSYRKYMPQEKVRSEIEKNAGKQFDPDVAETMLGVIDSDVDYVLHE
ncbi:MAG: HD domain-containing protein, partial [Lachnospiraceae bacterium]|nr:HD domain-containing protein [Lachnospiraceae bacterium]